MTFLINDLSIGCWRPSVSSHPCFGLLQFGRPRRRASNHVLGTVLLSIGLAAQLTAQPEPDTLDARLATITTDTGALAPGHRDFRGYTNPVLCLTAAQNARVHFQNRLAIQQMLDTLGPSGTLGVDDTVGVGAAAQVARACMGTRFPLAQVVPRDMEALFQLAAYAQDDTLATAALAALRQHGEESAGDGARFYLQLGRLAAAEALEQQEDARGTAAAASRLEVHELLAAHYRWRPVDSLRYRAELGQMLRLSDSMPGGFTSKLSALEQLMAVVVWTHPDSVRLLAEEALQTITPVRAILAAKHDHRARWTTPEQVLQEMAPPYYTFALTGGTVAAPRLQADYWYPPPGAPASDTIRPVPGKINLICRGGEVGYDPDASQRQLMQTAYDEVLQIRRWLARYGPDNLAVTLVWPAPGYNFFMVTHLDAEGSPGSGRLFQRPVEEAQLWDWYVHAYAKLPVTVAVQRLTSTWLPAPDERRLTVTRMQLNDVFVPPALRPERADADWADPVFGQREAEGWRRSPSSCLIVGRSGRIAYRGETAYQLDMALRWVFQHRGEARSP